MIYYLYFSDVYLFFYKFWKVAVYLELYLNWGTFSGAAKCTRAVALEPLTTGPEARETPLAGLEKGTRARARYRTTATVMAGGVLRARASDHVHSTQDSRAHHKTAATPTFGHRRRRQRQWRAAVLHRNHAEGNGDLGDELRREKGRERRGTARKLTPETTEVTARHGEDRRRRNRGRGHAVVRAVKRQRRRGDGIPARVARRGRRGGPGAPFCHGDSSTEARSDGNVAATASSDAVGIRVRVCGRHRASERGKRPGEER